MSENKTVWLVYDGECPICKPAVSAFKIKQAAGKLEVINARDNHPIMQEIKANGWDINKGMVLKMEGNFYYGAEALNICALIGSNSDFFNKLNVAIFRSKTLSKIAYPIFVAIKNSALCLKGTGKIS